MVFASLNPTRNTYRLWHRFRMPTSGGPKDAVAVTTKVGDQLLAAYTFMLSHIVLLVWWIAIIIALFLSAKIHKHNHRNSKLHVKIWNKRSSPYRIVKLAFHRFLWPHAKPKRQSDSRRQSDIEPQVDLESKPSRLYLLLWFLIAISFAVVKYAIPIYFAGFIRIGNAAPVSPDAIYIPSILSIINADITPLQRSVGELQVRELFIPSALRAVGGIDAANDTFKGNPPVIVDLPEILGTDANGEISMQIGYRYNVTGLDLGLQHYPDLLLKVEGACMTEYGWWLNSTTNDSTLPGAFVETYDMFDTAAKVSKYDGGSPIAQFYLGPSSTDQTNTSWAALISSVDRSSYTVGIDPFYRTGPNPLASGDLDDAFHAPNIVLPQRPVLSCWESNVWSHHGQNVAASKLNDPTTGILPGGLAVIIYDFVGTPMISSLGGFLGQSALKSSATSLAAVIDASQSSIYADLQRLLFASYIATTNIFTETSLFSSHGDIPNDVIDPSTTGSLYPGASDFVIFSNEVETLSVKALIIIPTITVALWTILTVITLLPNIVAMIASFYKGKEEDVVVKGDKVEKQEEKKEEKTTVKKGDKKKKKKKVKEEEAVKEDKEEEDRKKVEEERKKEEEERTKTENAKAGILQPAIDAATNEAKKQEDVLKEDAEDIIKASDDEDDDGDDVDDDDDIE